LPLTSNHFPIKLKFQFKGEQNNASQMAYIVDGNNVMGQTLGWHRDKAKARRRLLEQLALFARMKKSRVTVVFDGSPDRDLPDGSGFRGVKIHFAEKGSDADNRIIKLVASLKDKRGFIVVTSDRDLAFKVRAKGAAVLRSGEFRKQLETALQTEPLAEDGEHFEMDDMNEWLRYFGATPEDEK
jgi:predicted RNA-binding protein with PIN domain